MKLKFLVDEVRNYSFITIKSLCGFLIQDGSVIRAIFKDEREISKFLSVICSL